MNGYGTEVERTFFLGEVPRAAIKPYQVMMEARQLCFEMCRPGVDMHDVDHKIVELFTKYGYGDNILHRTGHSIGVTGHEGPFLAKGFHYEITENMLFTIEPGIYIEGLGGFRHSDTVLITKDSCDSLTPVRDRLAEMTLPASSKPSNITKVGLICLGKIKQTALSRLFLSNRSFNLLKN